MSIGWDHDQKGLKGHNLDLPVLVCKSGISSRFSLSNLKICGCASNTQQKPAPPRATSNQHNPTPNCQHPLERAIEKSEHTERANLPHSCIDVPTFCSFKCAGDRTHVVGNVISITFSKCDQSTRMFKKQKRRRAKRFVGH